MDISVCIPTYNEEESIVKTVKGVKKELLRQERVNRFEIIVSDGGSTDRTLDLLEKTVQDDRIKTTHPAERLYYGESIRDGFKSSKYSYFIVIDGDGSIPPQNLDLMLDGLQKNDVVLGRRKISDRKKIRGFLSYIYNRLNRLIFNSEISDHQCGFKGFKKKKVENLFYRTEDNHWYWDTEILHRIQSKDISLEEIEIEWNVAPDSTVNLVTDSLILFKKTLKFRLFGKPD